MSCLVEHSRFRISKINEPEYAHWKLLLWWPVYFLLFFLTERCIPEARCTPVHIWLDDLIPFNEWFVIPYMFWYGLVAYSLVHFLRQDAGRFRELQTYIVITQICGIAAYILFPTRQELRPEIFPRENALSDCVGFLYSIDTNTGVCPSMHVAWSVAVGSVWFKDPHSAKGTKWFIMVWVILICLSTMFVKQHSALDVLAALPVCLLAEIMVYGKKTA